MERYINKENKFATYQSKKESFVVERTSNQGTGLYSFSSLKSVRSEQIIDSDDRPIINNSSMAVSTFFENFSSHYISSNIRAIPFKLPEEQCIASVLPKIDSVYEPNEAPKIDFKIKPIKPIPILDLRKRRVDLNTPVLDLRNRRVETYTPILDLRKESNKTKLENLDFSKKEFKKVKPDLDLPNDSANEECQILDLSIKRVEITKTDFTLTKNSSKLNHRNLHLTGKQPGITKPEFDLQKACVEFPVSVLHIDETISPISNEKIGDLSSQNIATEAKKSTYEQDLAELDYYPESQLDFPVNTLHNNEKESSISIEKNADLNYPDLESNDDEESNEEDLPELDYYPETPLDSPVFTPRNERVSPTSKEKLVDFKSQGIEVRRGEWPNEEDLPELDYYPETSLDSPVITLYNERISPISKEKLVDFKFQGNEVRRLGKEPNEALPELDTTEAPVDFPVSRLHIDETVNRISKEKIVSPNSTGIEVKDGDGSCEILSELDITEAPIDFPLPILHSDENINSITEEKIASLKSEGVVIRNGEWSVEEEALLKRNYKDFLKQYRIRDSRLLFRRNLKTYIQSNKFLKAKHFYVRLGKDINERTLKSIYYKARSMFL